MVNKLTLDELRERSMRINICVLDIFDSLIGIFGRDRGSAEDKFLLRKRIGSRSSCLSL